MEWTFQKSNCSNLDMSEIVDQTFTECFKTSQLVRNCVRQISKQLESLIRPNCFKILEVEQMEFNWRMTKQYFLWESGLKC